MTKHLLALFAIQTVAQLAGAGDVVEQLQRLLGGPASRGIAFALVVGQVWFTCWVIWDEWRKEREARERLTR